MNSEETDFYSVIYSSEKKYGYKIIDCEDPKYIGLIVFPGEDSNYQFIMGINELTFKTQTFDYKAENIKRIKVKYFTELESELIKEKLRRCL